jgi:ABC-2 type transport system ATP-binding protein
MLTTHYMDEVEALADKVAVLNRSEIVASGTPTSIGGRDSSTVTIRFGLPDGVTVSDIPGPTPIVENGIVQISTDDELHVLHRITGWAIDHGHVLAGLAVTRVSLEDIYLSLTKADQ